MKGRKKKNENGLLIWNGFAMPKRVDYQIRKVGASSWDAVD